MTEKLQISKRLDDGTIVVIGGDSVTEFAANAKGMLGDAGADEIRALFYHLIPASAPAAPAAAPAAVDPFGRAATAVQAVFPQAAPPATAQSDVPLCPNHGQPCKLVPAGVSKTTGKPYGAFYSCPLSDRACRPNSR